MNLPLAQALRVSSSACIAFIGAGGKTTAMFQVARTLSRKALPVIVTATSHLGAWQSQWADQHLVMETPAPLDELALKGITLITGKIEADRLNPVSNEVVKGLKQFCDAHTISLLIEADGSRQKPVKAWAAHEPPIPTFAELVVQVVGLRGLGKTLSEENVHRPEIFSRLSGLAVGETITHAALLRVLTHPQGGRKNMPVNAQKTILLNQADTPELQSVAQGLAKALIPAYHSVVISSLEQKKIFAVHEPVAGIVLAAGGSTRFGRPKQLLDWKGQPFVRAVARMALEAGLSPVIVVTGANAEQVETAVNDLNVTIVRNEAWKNGQGSSIREGIKPLIPAASARARAGTVGAAIFLLADQPQVNASILHALMEKHAEGLYPIVAPMVMNRRANPVLFDRITFADLVGLEGDVGGRAIFHKHRVEYLPWHDDHLLLDVDTPEMYQRLLADESP